MSTTARVRANQMPAFRRNHLQYGPRAAGSRDGLPPQEMTPLAKNEQFGNQRGTIAAVIVVIVVPSTTAVARARQSELTCWM